MVTDIQGLQGDDAVSLTHVVNENPRIETRQTFSPRHIANGKRKMSGSFLTGGNNQIHIVMLKYCTCRLRNVSIITVRKHIHEENGFGCRPANGMRNNTALS